MPLLASESLAKLAEVQSERARVLPKKFADNPLRTLALNTYQSRNAALDVLFYDVTSVTKQETHHLAASIVHEGDILLVPPTGAGALSIFRSVEDLLAQGPTAAALAVAGVGSSSLGAAAFARNVADALGAPVAAVVSGPLVGLLVGRHPRARTPLAVGTLLAVGVVWLAVTVPSTPVPFGVLVVFVTVVAVGGPTSLVAFDVARSCTPPARLGTATGFVNTGGFVGALATMLVVGVVLDRVGGDARDLDAFRAAFAWVALPWALGVLGMLLGRRPARRAHPGLAV